MEATSYCRCCFSYSIMILAPWHVALWFCKTIMFTITEQVSRWCERYTQDVDVTSAILIIMKRFNTHITHCILCHDTMTLAKFLLISAMPSLSPDIHCYPVCGRSLYSPVSWWHIMATWTGWWNLPRSLWQPSSYPIPAASTGHNHCIAIMMVL